MKLYRHFDSAGRLLYVGVSLFVINRLVTHKYGSAWARDIAKIEITSFSSKSAALKAERLAIRTENPMHNKMGVVRRTGICNHRRPQVHTAYFGIKLPDNLKKKVELAAKDASMDVSTWIRCVLIAAVISEPKNGRRK